MNTNQYPNPQASAGLPTGFVGGAMINAQPNPSAATSTQFQSNGAASQMVPLMLQMQPTGNLSFFPLQAQAQGFQQSTPTPSQQWFGMSASQPNAMSHSQPPPQLVPNTPGFASPSHAMAAMNDLMTLAAAMQQTPAEVPVGSLADDEEILVKALRKGRARGLNCEQALRGLHNVNRRTETAWKNYFLAHLDRLYPKVHERKDRHLGPETPSGSRLQPLYLTNGNGIYLGQSPRSALPKSVKHEKPPSASYGHQKPSSRHDSGPRSEQTSDRHNDKATANSQDRHRYPNQAKHASFASPKEIGIKKPRIRRRVVRSPTPTPEPSGVSSSPEYTEPENLAYEDGSDPESEYGRAHGKGLQRGFQRVTEEDFRAMARYVYENPRKWGESPTGLAYWRGFAGRKENASRRSLDAWARASRTYQEKIVLYVEEYAGQVEQDDIYDSTPPTQQEGPAQESPSQDVSPHVPDVEPVVEELATVPRKRSPSPGGTTEREGPDEKRPRQEDSNGPPEASSSMTETGPAGSSESGTSGDIAMIPQEAQRDAAGAAPLDTENM
ncbi:hypothetical protein C8T65DRAFT_635989 [Cerioporus squamosus]|nr:hypothetical protein C8T65DRAFT_635989 [Cerioporus squamosus]